GGQPSSQAVRRHAALVHAVAVSPDGKTLATAGFDNLVKLWELAPDGSLKEAKTLKGHTGPVYAIAFHPEGEVLASASLDKTIRVWNPADGKTTHELKGHTDIVDTVGFRPDGKPLAFAGAAQKELKVLKGHDLPVTAVTFAGDANTLVSVSMDRTIRVWDVATGKETKKLGPTTDDPYAVVWSPDTKLIGVCGYSGLVSTWA